MRNLWKRVRDWFVVLGHRLERQWYHVMIVVGAVMVVGGGIVNAVVRT